MEGVRDVMEAAQGGHGRGRDQLELSPCPEQLPALLPLAAPDFPALFPSVNHSLQRGALTSGARAGQGIWW